MSPSSRSCSASAKCAGDRLDDRERVGDLGVDLARRGVALERPAQLRERHAGLRQRLEHDHRGDRPGVGAPVVAEVVVRRVLAAEDRVGLGHHLLDERVADAGAHRLAAVLADHLGHGLRADQVVDDGAAAGAGAASPRRRSRWWSNPRPARPGRRRGTRGRRRRRTRGRCRRRRRGRPSGASTRFSGWIGSAGWFGNVPSSSPKRTVSSNGRPSKTLGTTRPPMPLAVSATTLSGRSASTSTNERTWAAKSSSRSRSIDLAALLGPLEQARGDRVLDLDQAGVLARSARRRPGRA